MLFVVVLSCLDDFSEPVKTRLCVGIEATMVGLVVRLAAQAHASASFQALGVVRGCVSTLLQGVVL